MKRKDGKERADKARGRRKCKVCEGQGIIYVETEGGKTNKWKNGFYKTCMCKIKNNDKPRKTKSRRYNTSSKW